ncbi:unnamed protein product [Closterium sp. Naga37s-1]|nr:unnamed protein product [Closterium sp. Naga37s-1]
MANEYGHLSVIIYATSAIASATSPLRQFIWSAVRLQLFLASTCLSAICALPLLPFRLLSAALRENKMRASLAEAQQQGGYWREAAAALQQRAKREEAAREASEAAAREAAARLRKALAQRAQLKECLQRAVREVRERGGGRWRGPCPAGDGLSTLSPPSRAHHLIRLLHLIYFPLCIRPSPAVCAIAPFSLVFSFHATPIHFSRSPQPPQPPQPPHRAMRWAHQLGDEAAARHEAERGLARERQRGARLHADLHASTSRCSQLQADLAAASLALGRLREELAAATQRLTACQVAAEEAAAMEERRGGAGGGEAVWGGGGGDEQEPSRGREGRGQRGRRGRGGQLGRTTRAVQGRGEEGVGSEWTTSASSSSHATTAPPPPSRRCSSSAPPSSLHLQPHALTLPTEPLLWRAALKATAAALLLTTLLALLACPHPHCCPPAPLTLLALTALAALFVALALALAMPPRRPSASPALTPASYRARMVAAAAAAAVPLLCACWFALGLLTHSLPAWPAVSRALYSHAPASLERAISSFWPNLGVADTTELQAAADATFLHDRREYLIRKADHEVAVLNYEFVTSERATRLALIAEYNTSMATYVPNSIAWAAADNRACTILLGALPDALMRRFQAREMRAHLIWTELQSMFERRDISSVGVLFQEYFSITLATCDGAVDYVGRMQEVADRLAARQAALSEPLQIHRQLFNLTPDYESRLHAFTEANPLAGLTEVTQWIIDTEVKLRTPIVNLTTTPSSSTSLNVTQPRNPGGRNGGGGGRGGGGGGGGGRGGGGGGRGGRGRGGGGPSGTTPGGPSGAGGACP